MQNSAKCTVYSSYFLIFVFLKRWIAPYSNMECGIPCSGQREKTVVSKLSLISIKQVTSFHQELPVGVWLFCLSLRT